MSTITVTPIAGSLGAEVRGVDLRTMDNHAWAQVHQAFLDHKVIAIRDQDLGAAGHDGRRRAVRRAQPLSVREGPRRLPVPVRRDQGAEREAQLRRRLALRHDLHEDAADGDAALRPRDAAQGRRHALLRHGGGLQVAVGAHEGDARQPERRVQRRPEELGRPQRCITRRSAA